MAFAFDYATAPKEGTVLNWSGQTYTLARSISFKATTGERIVALTWRTQSSGCGATLEIKTGGRKKWLPKRCKSCNGADDLDSIERQHYAKRAWSDRLQAAKATRRAERGADPIPPAIEGAKLRLNPAKVMIMDCVLVYPGGKREPWAHIQGMEIDPEEATPALLAAVPALEAEFKRLDRKSV